MKEIQVKDSDLRRAAEQGMDEFGEVFYGAISDAVGGQLTADNMAQLNAFENFVRRRKAYLLVSLGRYDEAEHLLKLLLDDPDNSDFALNELAYIQQKKK